MKELPKLVLILSAVPAIIGVVFMVFGSEEDGTMGIMLVFLSMGIATFPLFHYAANAPLKDRKSGGKDESNDDSKSKDRSESKP